MKRYEGMGNMVDDYSREGMAAALKETMWRFENLLPFTVYLYRRVTPTQVSKIGVVEAKKSISALKDEHGMKLRGGDLVHILFLNDGKFYEITRSEQLRDDSRLFKIGDIVYENIGPSFFDNIHTDISGVKIHNHLSMPIEVWFQDKKLGYVHGCDDKGYLGGSQSITYIDNDCRGFRLGDELVFRIPYVKKLSRDDLYAKVLLVDNMITDIHVGKVSYFHVPPPPDTYAYRASSQPYTGITYYVPERVDAYMSRRTNPRAVL
jgi:hypothetical protein